MIRTTHVWILVLVAVFLSGLSTWQRTSSVKQQKSEVVLLLPQDTINFNGVVKISLDRGVEELVFERKDGIWLQTQPVVCKMDTPSMMTLIERAQGLLQLGHIDRDVSLETLGLGENARSLTLTTKDDSLTILLGRMTFGGRA